jgi:hypothetical protein
VSGISHYPCKVKTAVRMKKITKKSKIKIFVNVYNYNHLIPTRYFVAIPETKLSLMMMYLEIWFFKCKTRQETKVKFKKDTRWVRTMVLLEALVLDACWFPSIKN